MLFRLFCLPIGSLALASLLGATAMAAIPSNVRNVLEITTAMVGPESKMFAPNCDVGNGYNREHNLFQSLQAANLSTIVTWGPQYAYEAAACALHGGPNAEALSDQAAYFQMITVQAAYSAGVSGSSRYRSAAQRAAVIAKWLAHSRDQNLRENARDEIRVLRQVYGSGI